MSDEILSEQEWEHWFAILCRSDAPFHHLYTAEEKLRLHERALLADRDRLAARVATLEAALREVLDAILTPSDPASDQHRATEGGWK